MLIYALLFFSFLFIGIIIGIKYFYKQKIHLIYLDGNIASGKTTLIKKLLKNKNTKFIELIEPIDEWNKISDDKTLFEHYYNEPSRWSYSFQHFVLILKFNKLVNILGKLKNNTSIIIERSFYTDNNVFAMNCFLNKNMTFQEYKIYKIWYEFIKKQLKSLDIEEHYVYIDVDPSICYDRLRMRNRQGENDISLDYLKKINDLHKIAYKNLNQKNIIVINNNQDTNIDEITKKLI